MNKKNKIPKFDKNYYENGIKLGISGYENYHWMPSRSISEAVTISETIKFNSCIDYGCAKGFLTYAINLLGFNCIGIDISEYAIKNCHPKIKDKLFILDESLTKMNLKSDLIIAKDVLEHIPESTIPSILKDFNNTCKYGLFVIPLGDNDAFRIREYEIDKTHVTKKNEEWWIEKIIKAGFKLKKFDYVLGNVKEKWTQNYGNGFDYKYGNGFFIVENINAI